MCVLACRKVYRKIQKRCLSILLEISDLTDHASAPEIRFHNTGGIKARLVRARARSFSLAGWRKYGKCFLISISGVSFLLFVLYPGKPHLYTFGGRRAPYPPWIAEFLFTHLSPLGPDSHANFCFFLFFSFWIRKTSRLEWMLRSKCGFLFIIPHCINQLFFFFFFSAFSLLKVG